MADSLYGAVELGLLYALMALGVYITFRILDFPDLTILGVSLSNGLVAMSGALITQQSGFADISMGIGMIVIGLASVIIGEAIFGSLTVFRATLAVLLGSIVYRIVIALALRVEWLDASDLKLITALITTLTEDLVRELNLTTLMVTHNMEQAIRLGNRLTMMDKGRIVLDVDKANKQDLTVGYLLSEFERISGHKLSDDRLVLG